MSTVRVVVDTNVFISALLFGGNAEKILLLAETGHIELITSDAILKELAGVLKQKFHFDYDQLTQAQSSLISYATIVNPVLRLKVIEQQDADNRIIECAVTGDAHFIISGDKRHLLPLKEYQGIKVLSPASFLEVFFEDPNVFDE